MWKSFVPLGLPPHSLDSDLRGLHRDCGRLPGLLWDGHDEDPGAIQDPGVQQGSNNERMTFKTGVTSDLSFHRLALFKRNVCFEFFIFRSKAAKTGLSPFTQPLLQNEIISGPSSKCNVTMLVTSIIVAGRDPQKSPALLSARPDPTRKKPARDITIVTRIFFFKSPIAIREVKIAKK